MKLTAQDKRIILTTSLKSLSFKGISQSKHLEEKAENFLSLKMRDLDTELWDYFQKFSSEDIVSLTQTFSERTGFPELACDIKDAEVLKQINSQYGVENVISDFLKQKTKTTLLTFIPLPAFALLNGLGDVDPIAGEEWMYGIAMSHPLASDTADDVVDGDYSKHDSIPYDKWGIVYKVGAASIFKIGQDHARKIKSGDEKLDKEIIKILEDGITEVSKANRLDVALQKMKNWTKKDMDYVNQGKIGGIQKVVFETVPSRRRDVVSTFGKGAWHLAQETQGFDNLKDANGQTNEDGNYTPPRIPNPSYMLLECRNGYQAGLTNLKDLLLAGAYYEFRISQENHKMLKYYFSQLPNDFSTKPTFRILVSLFGSWMKNEYKKFKKGETIEILKPELAKLL